MRIAVVNTQVPFVRGGAEQLSEWLVDRLREHGHSTELVRLPFWVAPPQTVLENALAAHFTRITGADRVIALKFPCYYVPHDDKVLWVLHQHRPAYELWRSDFQHELPDTIEGRFVRRTIVDADNRLLREVRRVFCISQVIARRMLSFNGFEPTVLYPPVGDERRYYCDAPGNFLFLPSRLAPIKRQDLAVAAMRHVSSDVKLVIAGPGDMEWLARVAADHDVADRVELFGGWMPEERKLELLSRCLGVLFPPYDEDYGYVTLEAFLSSKPVITCTDSGGPVELVEDGVSGWVAEPDARAIAEGIDRLAADRNRAARMGAAGRDRVQTLEISWDHVVEELTA
jgi:glycosyltransferase involved in cell wall biosynthesis